MADPSLIDDDEDEGPDESPSGGGALAQLLQPQSSTKEAKADASAFLKKYQSGATQAGEQDILSSMNANAESVKQALRDARDKLSALQPTPRENQLAMAQAWLSPTRTGRFGDTLANVAGEQKNELEKEREFQQQQALGGVDLSKQLYGIDAKSLDAKMALQKLHEQGADKFAVKALGVEAAPDKAPGGVTHTQLKVIDVGGGMKQRVLFDPVARTTTPQGEPFSDQLPPNLGMVDPIGTYHMPGFSQYALTKPGAMETMNAVMQKYPNYQEGIYNQINQTRKEFTSSAPNSSGGKLSSLNLAISHMHILDQAADALHNNDIKQLNRLGNFLGVQTGEAAPAVYDAIKTFVGSEIANAVSQTSGVNEREEAGHKVSRDFSGPVTHAVTKAYRSMLVPRMNNLKNQFYAGMGMPTFDEGTPAYDAHHAMVDSEWRARILPRTAYELNPAPAAAVSDLSNPDILKQNPTLLHDFKAKYGYLPSEIE